MGIKWDTLFPKRFGRRITSVPVCWSKPRFSIILRDFALHKKGLGRISGEKMLRKTSHAVCSAKRIAFYG